MCMTEISNHNDKLSKNHVIVSAVTLIEMHGNLQLFHVCIAEWVTWKRYMYIIIDISSFNMFLLCPYQ